MRSVEGPNLGSVLLTVGIAALLYKAAELPIIGQIPMLSYALVAFAVVLVIGVVVTGSLVRVLVALFGILILVVTIGGRETLVLGVLAAGLLWLLGVARGFLG